MLATMVTAHYPFFHLLYSHTQICQRVIVGACKDGEILEESDIAINLNAFRPKGSKDMPDITMEFTYASYNILLTRNENDFVLYAKHKDTSKAYRYEFDDKYCFTEHDDLGSIGFIANLAASAFKGDSEIVTIKCDESNVPESITFIITYVNPLFPKPIVVSLHLPELDNNDSAVANVEHTMTVEVSQLMASRETLDTFGDKKYVTIRGCGGVLLPTCYICPWGQCRHYSKF
jgi:hypothetical protein